MKFCNAKFRTMYRIQQRQPSPVRVTKTMVFAV